MVDDGEGGPRRSRNKREPITPIQKTLIALDAPAPGPDEVAAIRAIVRGHASPGQQRVAMAYIVGGLCGAGRVAYGGEKGIFLNGARAISVAIGQIADAVYLRFPNYDAPPENPDETEAS